MPNRNYIAGRNFEYEVKRYYEKIGYIVFRTAGSHSCVDLIGVHQDFSYPVLFIQCKKHNGKNKPNLERNELSFLHLPGKKIFAVKKVRQRGFDIYEVE